MKTHIMTAGKRLIALLVAGGLLLAGLSLGTLQVSAEETEPIQHTGSAVVGYNNGVMGGQGLQNVIDGDLTSAYVSEDAPDLSEGKQYIQLNWEEAISFDQVVLYAQYCGSDSTQGQAPTAWDIYVSENGTDGWTNAASSGTVAWEAGDAVQLKVTDFDLVSNVKGVRVVITAANLDWNHYVVNELQIINTGTQNDSGTDDGNTDDGNTDDGNVDNGDGDNGDGNDSDTQAAIAHASTAAVSYNAGVMSGQGLPNVTDGVLTTAYVSEDNPDMSNGQQYIQLNWEEAISLNQVVVHAQYCGTADAPGQAPTAWDIYVSENGTDGWTKAASSGTVTWEAGDDPQFISTVLDEVSNVMGVRIVITAANLDWNHYAVSEVEVNWLAQPGGTGSSSGGSSGSGDSSDGDDSTGSEDTTPTKTVYHSQDATVTYNDSVMNGQGLQNVKDYSHTNAYVSEDNPDMSDGKQYIQMNWGTAISFNQVVLYSQYCGSASTAGQAPTAWDIYVSENGTDGWTKVAASGPVSWAAGDNLQSKTTNLDLTYNVRGVRIVITDANLDWGHYAIYGIEINDAPVTSSDIPTTGDHSNPALMGIMMIGSALAVAWLVYDQRKNRDTVR